VVEHIAMALYRLMTAEDRNINIVVRVHAAGMGSWHTGASYIPIGFKS